MCFAMWFSITYLSFCAHACVCVLEIYHLELAHVITRGESWTAELML